MTAVWIGLIEWGVAKSISLSLSGQKDERVPHIYDDVSHKRTKFNSQKSYTGRKVT